jgi:WD40 repeat protein
VEAPSLSASALAADTLAAPTLPAEGHTALVSANEIGATPVSLPPREQPLAVTHEHPGRYSSGARARELGRGGIGRVFVALDEHLGREVAIKELLPERGEVRAGKEPILRFLREARVTGQLEHPNIVPVYELGRRADGALYYTMRIVRGQTLSAALTGNRDLGARLRLVNHFSGLCQAIAYAHSRGVVHRDIKPDNVMIGEFGETVVLDWGLAKLKSASEEPESHEGRALRESQDASVYHSKAGRLIGTPAYMSPEQALGLIDEIDERSDVWALGAVLYTILAGKPPFSGSNLLAIFDAVLNRMPEPLRQIDPDIPPDLAAIAERALTRDKLLRYQTARELVSEVEAYQSGARVNAYEYSSFELIQRFVERHRFAVLITFAVTVVTVALLTDAWFRVVAARDRAVLAESRARDNERQAERSLAEALTEKATGALTSGDSVAAELFAAKALTLEERADARGIVLGVTQRLAPVPRGDDPRLRGSAGCVLSAAARHAACRAGARVTLWDARKPGVKQITVAGPVTELALAQNGDRLLVMQAGELSLWDVPSATRSRSWPASAAGLSASAISRDARVVASADASGAVVMRDAELGQELARLAVGGAVSSLEFSERGDVLAVGGRLGSLRLWRWKEGAPPQALAGHDGTVLALAFSPTGKYLASGASDRTLRIWEVSRGAPLGNPHESAAAVSALSWSPSSRYLAYGSRDKRLRVLDVTQRGATLQLRGHDAEVSALRFSADSRALASVSSDVGLRWWSLVAPALPPQLNDPANVLSLALTPSSELFSAGLGKHGVCLRRLPGQACETRLPTDVDHVRALTVSPSGKLLVVAGTGGRLFVWDVATRLPLHVWDVEKAELRALAFSSDSRWLAAAGTDVRVRVWDMAQARLHGTFASPTPVHALAFRPGSDELVSVGRDGRVHFWSVERLWSGGSFEAHPDWIFGVAFTGDGRAFVTASGDRTLRVWSTATRSPLLALRGHEGRVLRVAVAGKERRVVSAGEDASVRIWSLDSGRELALLKGHDGVVRDVQLSADESLVASGGDDGTIRLWPLARLAEPGSSLLDSAERRYRVRVSGMKLDFD